jgi:dihydrofolate synthase / folylpolyglutamate synthase
MSPNQGSPRFARVACEHYKYARKCPQAEGTELLSAPFINKIASRMPIEVDSRTRRPPEMNPAYDQALEYLYSRINYEKIGNTPYNQGNYRLDRMRQLLEILGNPHRQYDVVHVAGTKGKGTTSTLIAAGLTACGLKTGLYTSPHLLRLEERIQFQGVSCSESELVGLVQRVRQAAERLERTGSGRATFFELTTAMGMLHFANCHAQVVVLEVGLGGRLDSTNVCSPLVTVITSISLDHQAQLGNTIEAIAREKGGIIKAGIPLVCSARAPAARQAITEIAANLQAPCRLIERDFSVSWSPLLQQSAVWPARAQVMYSSATACAPPAAAPPAAFTLEPWTTRMLGRHQADNIGAALATFEMLRQHGKWNLPEERLRQSLASTQPPARLEIVGDHPLSVIDSAHNPASIQAGLDALADHFPGRPLTVVFAASRDKDWREMLEMLMRHCQRLILTSYRENPRGLPTEELVQGAEQILGSQVPPHCLPPVLEASSDPVQAWLEASRTTHEQGLLLATGSFFLAAEIMAAMH